MLPDFFCFLSESLQEIRSSEPDVDRAIELSLGSLRARLVTEGVSFVVSRVPGGWRIEQTCAQADVHLIFDKGIVLDLIGGAVTLNQAILDERLSMFGSVDKIARFYDVLLIYVEGLLRAPGTSALLGRYLEV
jgi:hypothetical protein